MTIKPVSVGLTIPGRVANVFDMPNIILACLGARSNGFTLKQNQLVSIKVGNLK